MTRLKLSLALAVTLLALVWCLQNAAPVQARFLLATVTLPLAALLVITFLVGLAVGLLVAFGWRARPPAPPPQHP